MALRALWAVLRKDLAVFWRTPAVLAVTLLPPVMLLFVLALEGASVGSVPVAIVNRSPAPVARQAAKTLLGYAGFRGRLLPAGAAQAAFRSLSVAAVITIPPDFAQALASGARPVVTQTVRNFNADFTNDLRRDLPDALQKLVLPRNRAAVPVAVREHDLQPHDASFLGFQLIAVLVLLLLQAGIVNAGMAAVAEWQSGTVKELLLAPASPLALIAGKVLAGVIAADLVGVALGGGALAAGFFSPLSVAHALLALLAMTLLGALGAGIGVGLASVLRSFERLGPASILLSFYLFFLAGGIAAIAYLPAWLRTVARFVPNSYAMDALRGLLLYGRAPHLTTDLLVLLAWLVLVMAVGPRLLRRSLSR